MSRSLPLALLLVAVCGPAARAEPKMDLQQLHLPATSSGYLAIDAPTVLPHLRGAVGLLLSHGQNPLVLRDANGDVVRGGTIVRHQTWFEAVGSAGFFDRVELGLAVPVAMLQEGDPAPPANDLAVGLRDERGAALGDLRLDAKVLFVDHLVGARPAVLPGPLESPHRLRLGAVVGMTMPTSSSGLAGERNVTGRPRLLLEWAYRRIRLVVGVGAVFRERARIVDLDITHQLTWAVGLRVLAWRTLEVHAESRGVVGVAPPRDAGVGPPQAPSEVEVGASYGWAVGLRLFVGGGIGLGEGYGTPTGRFLFAARFVVPERKREAPWVERDDDLDGVRNGVDQCVQQRGSRENQGCPDLDRDGDGLIDRADRCPDQPGLIDGEGCPDVDLDDDGLPNRLDDCPKEAGPIATKGCPAKDADKDDVPDPVDRCPDKPGAADNDGCPDIDSDGDGLADRLDKCPFETEVYNGVADDDGCTDAGAPLVELGAGQLAVFEPIVFERRKDGREALTARSQKVVSAVGAFLRAHTEITRLRIDGHTDSAGGAIANLDLSLARAQLVRRTMVEEWKLDPKRILAQGFGANRPVVSNATPKGRARNRRIEFTILEAR